MHSSVPPAAVVYSPSTRANSQRPACVVAAHAHRRQESAARGSPRGPPLTITKEDKAADLKSRLTNNLVSFLVTGFTEGLRLVRERGETSENNKVQGPVAPGKPTDTVAVIEALRFDFIERAYFVTGNITDSIYDPDCYFADPTIGFKGLERWKANVRLLVPFLESPSIELVSIEVVPGRAVLQAHWVLRTGLRLPWRPYVLVNGWTDYELGGTEESKKIVRHVESWDISGWEALKLVFSPGTHGVELRGRV